MNARRSIVWFRLDLRLADNPALIAAANRGAVVPVYIWAPEEEGAWPPGAASRWWLHHSLKGLASQLRGLVIRRGSSLVTLRTLMKETGADAIFYNRRYEPALRARDAMVDTSLPTQTFNSARLFEPWELKSYRVFTPFYKACLKKTRRRPGRRACWAADRRRKIVATRRTQAAPESRLGAWIRLATR
jgi:deoxyribodipyrimidine photo-lyase